MMFEIKKISDRNQITIPEKVRDALGVGKDDMIVFTQNNEGLIIVSRLNQNAAQSIVMTDRPPTYEITRNDE